MKSTSEKVWTPDEIIIPPHGIEIARNGRPMYAKALGLKSIASVTGVIGNNNGWSKEQLMHWANKVGREHGVSHREFTDDAADIGKMAHSFVEHYLKGRPLPSFPNAPDAHVTQAMASFENFKSWFNNLDFHLIVAEYPLVSLFLAVGGTIDLVALVNGFITLVDLKTSNGVYDDHKAQVAAYAAMWEERFPLYPIQQVWILQIGKADGAFAHYQLGKVDLERGLLNFCLWRILEVLRQAKTKAQVDEAKDMMDRFNLKFNQEDYEW